eukprot:scaffold1152_cov65-Attheya_sp.AAC.1
MVQMLVFLVNSKIVIGLVGEFFGGGFISEMVGGGIGDSLVVSLLDLGGGSLVNSLVNLLVDSL